MSVTTASAPGTWATTWLVAPIRWLTLAAWSAGAAAQPSASSLELPRWRTDPTWVECGTSALRLRLGRDSTPAAWALTQGRLGGPSSPVDSPSPGLVERGDHMVQLIWADANLPWQGRLTTQSEQQPDGRVLQRLVGFSLGLGKSGTSLHLARQHVMQGGKPQMQRAATLRLTGQRLGLGMSIAEVAATDAAPTRTGHLYLRWQGGAWSVFAALKRAQVEASSSLPSQSARMPWVTEQGLTVEWSATERDRFRWSLTHTPMADAVLRLGLAFEHRI